MPELRWLYLTALLQYRTSGTCVALAEGLEPVSHDRLTRLLQGDGSGQTRRDFACRTLFVWERGYRILADTVMPKPLATVIESLAWVFSSPEHQPGYGLSLVLRIWTNGTRRIPLGIRVWRKGGPSKDELALAWLSQARDRGRCPPDDVLFDAWQPSKALLKRIRDDGWSIVCRLKKNRRFNRTPLRTYRRHPSWAATGWLTGGLNGLVVSYGAQYYATNRLTFAAIEVRWRYRLRAQSEEVMSVCQDHLC